MRLHPCTCLLCVLMGCYALGLARLSQLVHTPRETEVVTTDMTEDDLWPLKYYQLQSPPDTDRFEAKPALNAVQKESVRCSPYTSIGETCQCKEGFHGADCGLPVGMYGVPRTRPRKLIQAFPINHEIDLFEIRQLETEKETDLFVVLESNYSAFGKEKKLTLLWEHEHLLTGKTMHIFLDHFPAGGSEDGWVADDYLRTYLSRKMLETLDPTWNDDDLFLIMDADEIPRPSVLWFLRHYDTHYPVGFSFTHYMFGAFWVSGKTRLPVATTLHHLKTTHNSDAIHLRRKSKSVSTIEHAGWHFSWCQKPIGIQTKLTHAQNGDFPRWGDYPEKLDLSYIYGLVMNGEYFDGSRKWHRVAPKDVDVPESAKQERWRYLWDYDWWRDNKLALTVAHPKTPKSSVKLLDEVLVSVGGRVPNRDVPCDVPCKWSPRGGILITAHVLDMPPPNDILISMEGESYYPSLKLGSKHAAMSTTRFDSDIPMPYFSWAENNIQTAPVPFEDTHKAAVFIANNCHSHSNREQLVKDLLARMPVESVSGCLNNKKLPADEKRDKTALMRRYALYLAFENQRVDDYITEKLWGALDAGVLPVYFGAPNIKEHVPVHSIVSVDDFPNRDALAVHLVDILSNKTLYDSYHAWRRKPLPEWFVRKYNFTHVHSECRTCRWADAKRRGLDWDKARQRASRCVEVTPEDIRISGRKLRLFSLPCTYDTVRIETEGTMDVLLRDHRAIFDTPVSGTVGLPWTSSDIQWIVLHDAGKVSLGCSAKSVLSENLLTPTYSLYHRATEFFEDGVTLCTQLTVDRLPRLIQMTQRWLGPLSAVLYIGFRNDREKDELALDEVLKHEIVRRFVTIHCVYAPYGFATGTDNRGHGLQPYPVNLLRQISVEKAQTTWILYIEADMLPPSYGHDLTVAHCCGSGSKIWLVPLYRGTVAPNSMEKLKIALSNKSVRRENELYVSHTKTPYNAFESNSTVQDFHISNGQEPYYIARRENLPQYDVLYMGMLGDKVSQLRDMARYTANLHPKLFLTDVPSPKLGDAWISPTKTWRQEFVKKVHTRTVHTCS